MKHTGDICTKPGLFECPHCGQTVRMHANPKDHFPPCPKCRSGVYYKEIFLNELIEQKNKIAVAGNNDYKKIV